MRFIINVFIILAVIQLSQSCGSRSTVNILPKGERRDSIPECDGVGGIVFTSGTRVVHYICDGAIGAPGDNGIDGTDGVNGLDATFQPVELCETGGEVIFLTDEGYFAYFEYKNFRYLSILDEYTDYITTDGEKCKFRIEEGLLIMENNDV